MRVRTIAIGYAILAAWSVWPLLLALLAETVLRMYGSRSTDCFGLHSTHVSSLGMT